MPQPCTGVAQPNPLSRLCRAPDAALRTMTQAGGVSNVLRSANDGEYSSLGRRRCWCRPSVRLSGRCGVERLTLVMPRPAAARRHRGRGSPAKGGVGRGAWGVWRGACGAGAVVGEAEDGRGAAHHRVRALQLSVAVDADEALRLLVKVVLERDDDELELALVGARADELRRGRRSRLGWWERASRGGGDGWASPRDPPERLEPSAASKSQATAGPRDGRGGRGGGGTRAFATLVTLTLSSAASISSITKKGDGR